MWWHDGHAILRALVRAGLVLALSGAAGGCFQPLYADRPAAADGSSIKTALSAVDVRQIDAPPGTVDARVGVEVRNALLFGLTGGGPTPAPTHQLTVRLTSSRLQVIVDITTARPDIENYGINASYELKEIATGRSVLTGSTFARVSYDIPGSSQRFARSRGLRDAETRASQVIAENIRQRLASYFVAGS